MPVRYFYIFFKEKVLHDELKIKHLSTKTKIDFIKKQSSIFLIILVFFLIAIISGESIASEGDKIMESKLVVTPERVLVGDPININNDEP